MDGTARLKSGLLRDLAAAVAGWRGHRRIGRKTASGIECLLGLLAACSLEPLESLKLEACRYCLRQARISGSRNHLREAWLLEIECWQRFVAIGATIDALPELPPHNPFCGKGALEMHHFPAPRPLF